MAPNGDRLSVGAVRAQTHPFLTVERIFEDTITQPRGDRPSRPFVVESASPAEGPAHTTRGGHAPAVSARLAPVGALHNTSSARLDTTSDVNGRKDF